MPRGPDASLDTDWADFSITLNPRIKMRGPRQGRIGNKTLGLHNRDRLAFNRSAISLDEWPNAWIDGLNGERAPSVCRRCRVWSPAIERTRLMQRRTTIRGRLGVIGRIDEPGLAQNPCQPREFAARRTAHPVAMSLSVEDDALIRKPQRHSLARTKIPVWPSPEFLRPSDRAWLGVLVLLRLQRQSATQVQ